MHTILDFITWGIKTLNLCFFLHFLIKIFTGFIKKTISMSTVTSFTSPAETCTVHILHVEGRNESKRGRGFFWRSLGRQWWPAVAVVPGGDGVGGSSSSVLFFFLFLCFSSHFYFFSLPLSVFFFLSPLPPFFYSLSSLSALHFSSSSPPLSLRLPCIYRKTGERHGWGGHCAAAPWLPEEARLLRFSNTWEAMG